MTETSGNPKPKAPRLSEDDFRERFKAYMLGKMQTLADGRSVADYADTEYRNYLTMHRRRGASPEFCAAAEVKWCKLGDTIWRIEHRGLKAIIR